MQRHQELSACACACAVQRCGQAELDRGGLDNRCGRPRAKLLGLALVRAVEEDDRLERNRRGRDLGEPL
jgi:hypothetical protein